MGVTGNCAVVGCTQNTKVSNWKESICETHGQPHKNCPCNQPSTAFPVKTVVYITVSSGLKPGDE